MENEGGGIGERTLLNAKEGGGYLPKTRVLGSQRLPPLICDIRIGTAGLIVRNDVW